MKLEIKDRVYKLTRDRAPLSCIIPSRNTPRNPLLYFDEEKGYNRALRYARNQKSPFEDEQDGKAIVEPVIFTDGLLRVAKNNPILQEFLHYHPLRGKRFVEVDYGKDAAEVVEAINVEVDALVEAKAMGVEQLESIGRVLFSKDVSIMTSAELRRDVMIFARRNPSAFLNAINDPNLKLQSSVQKFFDEKLLVYRPKNREVYFNLTGNKKRMIKIPFGIERNEFLSQWFTTDDGVEVLAFLEKQM
tara:strand:+ start:1169 stop:1906 length:738 start_codon:yes stop_codon:yes gene_type:complete